MTYSVLHQRGEMTELSVTDLALVQLIITVSIRVVSSMVLQLRRPAQELARGFIVLDKSMKSL